MMTWAAVWGLLRRAPREAWWLLVIASVLGASVWSIQAYGDRRFEDGKRVARQGAVFDSVLFARVRARHDSAVTRTDSTVRQATRTAARVRRTIAAMPPEVRTMPEVAPVVTECTTLADEVDSLRTTINVERESAALQRIVADNNERAAKVVISAQRDTIVRVTKERDARVTKVVAGIGVGLGAVLGFLLGVSR